MSHGKEEKARHEVIKLHREDFDVDGRMAEIHAALHQQKEEAANQGTITDCFKKGNRKRTMIAMMMFFIQNATGTGWVIGYMSYFMQLADMSASRSFDATVGISGVMLVGNMFGWFSVEWLGRRGTALYGSIMLFTTLLIIGILAVISGGNNVLVAQVVFMGVWAFSKVSCHDILARTHTDQGRSISRHSWSCCMADQRRECYIMASHSYASSVHDLQRFICKYLGPVSAIRRESRSRKLARKDRIHLRCADGIGCFFCLLLCSRDERSILYGNRRALEQGGTSSEVCEPDDCSGGSHKGRQLKGDRYRRQNQLINTNHYRGGCDNIYGLKLFRSLFPENKIAEW